MNKVNMFFLKIKQLHDNLLDMIHVPKMLVFDLC